MYLKRNVHILPSVLSAQLASAVWRSIINGENPSADRAKRDTSRCDPVSTLDLLAQLKCGQMLTGALACHCEICLDISSGNCPLLPVTLC